MISGYRPVLVPPPVVTPRDSDAHGDDDRSTPRILFASYSSDIVGPTNSLLLLLEHLRIQHEVSVLVPGDGAFSRKLQREGIARHTLPHLSASAVTRVLRVIRSWNPDVVYLNSTCGAMRNVAAASIIAGIPYVCHVREMGGGKPWKRLWYLWPAAAVIAVSQACADSIERFTRPGRLHVVHNGVDLSDGILDPSADRGYIRSVLGVPETCPVILSVAHVCQRKGQEYAVQAMADVARVIPDVHLCIVGKLDGDPLYVDRLRARIEAVGLAHRVHILGYRSDTRKLYSGADLFLHTAVVDPHPRAVLEAMHSGLPVAAFATHGVSETVLDGVTGRLAAPGDVGTMAGAILQLLSNPQLRLSMAAAARKRVATHFDARASAERVERILSTVGHQGGVRAGTTSRDP
jgi:glycosyltransferase involved in cell wall biosynthesis